VKTYESVLRGLRQASKLISGSTPGYFAQAVRVTLHPSVWHDLVMTAPEWVVLNAHAGTQSGNSVTMHEGPTMYVVECGRA
jgi:hypothetical protein